MDTSFLDFAWLSFFFIGDLWSGLGSAAGGLFGMLGQDAANRSNESSVRNQIAWQRESQQASQAFSAQQAAQAMGFSREEANTQRNWSSAQAQRAMDFSSAQAGLQRNWEANMSNSAYQRQVDDMKAAGINPMMAAMKGGGASTPSASAPSGSVGSASAPSGVAAHGTPMSGAAAHVGNALGAGISSAGDVASIFAALANSGADVKLKGSQAAQADANTAATLKMIDPNLAESAARSAFFNMQTNSMGAKLNPELDKIAGETDVTRATAQAIRDKLPQELSMMYQHTGAYQAQADQHRAQTTLTNLHSDITRPDAAAAQRTPWISDLMRVSKPILDLLPSGLLLRMLK
ncbi:MAG: DNA pilot protein [Microvirus sp.]|nr:MAG: DNA pilot protein [Microvirus sp.]